MKFPWFAAALAAPVAAAFAQAPAVFDIETAPAVFGSWSYSAQGGVSDAVFVDTRGSARATLRCTRATRRVTLSLASAAPAAAITVSTTSLSRAVPSRFDPGGQVVAELAVFDSLLDAIAFSRGRFALAIGGSPALVLPAGPEPARIVEDCRS